MGAHGGGTARTMGCCLCRGESMLKPISRQAFPGAVTCGEGAKAPSAAKHGLGSGGSPGHAAASGWKLVSVVVRQDEEKPKEPGCGVVRAAGEMIWKAAGGGGADRHGDGSAGAKACGTHRRIGDKCA